MSQDLTVAVPRIHGPASQELHFRSVRERFPVAAGLELTHRCNLACVHCYVNLAANDRDAQTRELTTDEWKRVLDQCADAGVLWLTLTGGEPLLRPDFCELYEYAHGKGFVVTVYTNATLITERHIELWTRCPPRMLEITQYGWSPEIYDKITDAGQQYDRFQRGLKRVRAAGVTVTLKAIALRDSVHELLEIRDFARRENMGFRYDAIISPRIDGGRKPLEQRLTPAQVVAIEGADGERSEAFADYCGNALKQGPKDERKYQCGAGINAITVDPYGKMHVCQLSRRPGWDILRDGLQRGFDEGFAAVRAEKRQDTSGCGSCGTINICSNCVGMSELEGRSPDAGDPYFCNVSEARGERFVGPDRPTPNGLIKLRLRGTNA
ncbi:MAG: putative Fe-S oxidoreductase [bacterium]|nr:putative Fe-S oxidoreductase [bacterium]